MALKLASFCPSSQRIWTPATLMSLNSGSRAYHLESMLANRHVTYLDGQHLQFIIGRVPLKSQTRICPYSSMMDNKLQGKVALVTGASRGIGRSIALELAGEGANVCVNFNKNREKADEVVSQIKVMKRSAIAVKADVSKKQDVQLLVAETVSKLGPIDILVNNAGIIHFGELLADDQQFEEMLQVNLMGVLYCAREVSQQMIKRSSGKIINISSVAGIGISETGSGGYAVTKAAVIMLTKRLGIELGPHGINVNCVAPGYIVTDMAGAGKT